jgi:hypothetical protein
MLEESGKKQADSIHYWLVGACASLLLLSNFSPWLSIAGISSVSGAKTDYGMFIFVTVVLLAVYVVSGVVKDTGLFRYQKLIKILSLASASLSLSAVFCISSSDWPRLKRNISQVKILQPTLGILANLVKHYRKPSIRLPKP